MGLLFGWRTNDIRETIWREDSSLGEIPMGVLEDWGRDGDASHLRPYAKSGTPTVFTFRALTLDESRYILGVIMGGGEGGGISGLLRAYVACFRIAVDFPGAPESFETGDGRRESRSVREHGLRMLAEPFAEALEQRYRGIIHFYGRLIYEATFPSEVEKKVSSPPSTPKPLSAAESTTADTVEAPRAVAEAA